jgi:Mg2+ and Co2+ transporter CorA
METTETIDQLLEEIEQAESEIEEQKELIFKLQQDEEFEGVSHSGNLKKARLQLKDMQRDLDELRRQIEEIEPFNNLATIALATLPE